MDKPKYDFYENAVFIEDPLQADISRKPRALAPKIGTEPRVPTLILVHLTFLDATQYSGADPWPIILPEGQARSCQAASLHLWLQARRHRSLEELDLYS